MSLRATCFTCFSTAAGVKSLWKKCWMKGSKLKQTEHLFAPMVCALHLKLHKNACFYIIRTINKFITNSIYYCYITKHMENYFLGKKKNLSDAEVNTIAF